MATLPPRLTSVDSAPLYPLRTSSFSSDVMSTRSSGAGLTPTAPPANPPPAYVAAQEASDLISAELGRVVSVAPSAITLLNEFLDHVLYSVICASHSLSLGQLKAAVPIVLKPRLGKSALKVAEEELKDYIEDDEADDLYSNKNSPHFKLPFDVDLVWKLARLRCMVYARMGDLEEEDEEDWLEREGLFDQVAALPTAARAAMAVAPGAAIFLTSVVEYLGEQALYYAAQYAQRRHDAAHRNDNTIHTLESRVVDGHYDILLEGKDMNHVGRDSPLSRLWRSWRRNTRSPADGPSRPTSPDDVFTSPLVSIPSHMSSSSATRSQSPAQQPRMSIQTALTSSRAPLPISEDTIDEAGEQRPPALRTSFPKDSRRPLSMPSFAGWLPEDLPGASEQAPEFQERSPLRPKAERQRSSSLPIQHKALVDNATTFAAVNKSDERVLHDTRSPTQESIAISARPKSTPPFEQVDYVTGASTEVLSAVGVHHVRQPQVLHPLDVHSPNSLPADRSSSTEHPLTSASITGPGDFDMMYEPDGRLSSAELDAHRSGTTPAPDVHNQQMNPYRELAAQQLEEHRRYSEQSHDMETPSIYVDQEQSPRFPRDSQSERGQKRSSQIVPAAESSNVIPTHTASRDFAQAPDQSASVSEFQTAASPHALSPEPDRAMSPYVPPSYAPTPEPGVIYDENGTYIYDVPSGEPGQSWQRQTDSPVSQMSVKYPAKRYLPADDPVPEVPHEFLVQKQPIIDDDHTTRSQGHSKSSSSSSRLLGFTRDVAGKPHTVYQQRANGAMTEEMRMAHSSTPEHTRSGLQENDQSTSTSSPKRQHLRIRGDSENNVLDAPSSGYHTQRSLEHLINSDETLHYTLTPPTANFQEETIPSSKRTPTQDLADFFKNTAPPGQENTPLPSTRSRKASMNATRAPQVIVPVRGPVPSSKNISTIAAPRQKSKNPLGEPRDPKVDRMSEVRDLADYARSTGPSNSDQLPKALGAHSMISATHRAVEMPALDEMNSRTSRPPNRLQARDPRPSRHAEPTDLVAFIRDGPPRSKGERNSDRGSASARTTTASDDSNNRTSYQTKASSDTNGISSVTDSQSPLLNSDNRPYTPTTTSIAQQVSQAESTRKTPVKKQRKPKDPYAIDYSDDDQAYTQPPKQKNEESLIDFLRNTEPPSESSTAQRILASAVKRPKPTSTNSTNNMSGAIKDSEPSVQPQTRARANSPHLTQSGSKLDSYRPTQVTHASHVDRNRQKTKGRGATTTTTRTGNGNSNRPPSGNTQVMKAFVSGGPNDTADFTEFLKTTGPSSVQAGWTEPLVNRPANGVGAGGQGPGSGGLRKFFSMKKK